MTLDNLKIIYAEVRDRLKDQLLSVDQITTKLSILLGANGVIAAVLIQEHQKKGIEGLLITALVLIMLSIGFCMFGINIISYRRDPDPLALYEDYKEEGESVTIEALIETYINACEENDEKIKGLTIKFRTSLAITGIAIVMMFIYYINAGI